MKDNIDEFKTHFQGEVLLPDDAGYDEVRQIWNAMIDRKPALIARCTSTEDVMQAIQFGRTHNLLISIRGGGHNIAGNAVCDDGLMIDLSLMKDVQVDVTTRTASVGPGCTLGDFDRVVQAHGLATPLGINSTTGVAGLTLGGGFGWLSRKYGMTIDNLLSAEVITADGRQLNASESENADLFWGLRGGGGNFGVVTRKAPPLPFLPAEVHGREMIALALCYVGDPEEGERIIAPLREFGTVLGEHVGVQPYTAWQQAFDPLLAKGARNYWKSHNFAQISDGVIDAIIEYAARLPSPHCEIFIGTIGGQTTRVAPEAMAYSSRDANYVMNVHGRWETAAEDERCIAWAREFFARSQPFASSGAYINFLTQEETDRIAFAYGATWNRLVELKSKYDPTNLFRMNQNIKPV